MLAAVLFAALPMAHAQAMRGRFLYVVGCDARVDKLDTLLNRKSATYDLATRTGKPSLVPAVSGTFDGCLANGVVYAPATSTFYTVVPNEAEPNRDGSHDYHVLAFAVPDLRLAKHSPAGKNLKSPPTLFLAAGSVVRVADGSEILSPTDLDLSDFSPDNQKVPNQILEISGPRVLLRLFSSDPNELVIAVADRGSKSLVRLKDLPPSNALNVHLAPGGAEVWVEVMANVGYERVKMGRFVLFESERGEKLEEFSVPAIRTFHFLALSPNGRAIYHAGSKYAFVDLKRKFKTDSVWSAPSTQLPGMFFADK